MDEQELAAIRQRAERMAASTAGLPGQMGQDVVALLAHIDDLDPAKRGTFLHDSTMALGQELVELRARLDTATQIIQEAIDKRMTTELREEAWVWLANEETK